MIKVGVVGATGYAGAELLRLLAGHRAAWVECVTSRGEAGQPVTALYPNLRGHARAVFEAPDIGRLSECDAVFLATPHATAMAMVPALVDAGVRVIDISADFRLRDPNVWEQWYGQPHACPTYLEQAVYGLPELYREAIRGSQLVACPGCYATAVDLAFLPLLESGVVHSHDLIADAKTGASGAGRKASVAALLSELNDSFTAYAVAGHRHLPEIRQVLDQIAGDAVELTFVPHLAPMIRGIHATCYARLAEPDIDLQSTFEERFAQEPFVDVMPPGSHPQTRSVRAANVCRLAVHRPRNAATIVVLSVIDNLVKGASGQAIQNFNIMFDLDERTGLEQPAVQP